MRYTCEADEQNNDLAIQAVQSPMRVGGLNMKGVFTRTRTPKMPAHMLREYWTHRAAEGG